MGCSYPFVLLRWVLLPLGCSYPIGCPYPLRFVFVLVELLVAVDGKRPNSPGTAYLRARVAVKLAVIVKMLFANKLRKKGSICKIGIKKRLVDLRPFSFKSIKH